MAEILGHLLPHFRTCQEDTSVYLARKARIGLSANDHTRVYLWKCPMNAPTDRCEDFCLQIQMFVLIQFHWWTDRELKRLERLPWNMDESVNGVGVERWWRWWSRKTVAYYFPWTVFSGLLVSLFAIFKLYRDVIGGSKISKETFYFGSIT